MVILGAGLAGLCAAYELERRGHTVAVLEAEISHVGGRARTLRFDGGLYGEASAMRIPERHELKRHAPEGRILFAGEHASLSHTWMQGAFESALRAVREILTAG